MAHVGAVGKYFTPKSIHVFLNFSNQCCILLFVYRFVVYVLQFKYK